MVAWIILVASPCSMENVSVTLVHPMKPQLNSSLANLWSRATSSLSPVVEIDLLAQHFRPGKPNYERLKVALTKNLPLKMDFLLAIGELGCLYSPVCTHLTPRVFLEKHICKHF